MTQSIRSFFSGLSRVAFFTGILLLSAVLAAPSSVAQDVPVITEDQVNSNLEAGDELTVPITVRNLNQAADVNAVDVTLDYGNIPADFVEFETSGTLLDGFLTDQSDDEANAQATLSGASNDALGGGDDSGVLARVVLEVTGEGGGTATFPDVRFNDVNPPEANLDQASFEVITSNNVVKIENATAKVGNPSTVDVTATDLSGLGITNFDIEIEVEDPVELDSDNPVNVLADLDGSNASYDPSTDLLTISGISQDGLSGNGPLFELNTNSVGSEVTAPISFLGGTEFRDSNGNEVTSVALSDGELQVLQNGAPTANDDPYSTGEESTLEVTDSANGVLANDTDPDGDALSVSAVEGGSGDVGSQITLGSGASLTLDGDGTFAYTPPSEADTLEAGETTDDSFQYTAADGFGGTAQATATITLQGANDAPTISGLGDDDPTSVAEDNTTDDPVEFTVDDAEGNLSALTVTGSSGNTDLVQDADISVTGPNQGGAASLTVTPRPDSNGTTEITVEVSDGAASASGTFTLEVDPVNDPAVVGTNEGLTLEEGGSAVIPTDSLSASDVEDGAADLTFEVTGGPSNGTLLVGGSAASSFTQADLEAGAVAYSHDGSETTEDSFTFDLSDSEGAGPTGRTFGITVQPVNDAPTVAVNEGLTLEEGGSAAIPADSLSASDPDDPAADLTFEVTGGPSNGTLLVGGSAASSFTQADLEAGDVAYSHDGSETTEDSFTFDLSDSAGAGPTGRTFGITVQLVNEGPTISGLPEADTIDEDTSTDPIGFTIGDPETPPEDLSVTASSDNADLVPSDSIELGGSGADRTLTVTPTADSNGTADITVTVENGGEQTASQTFALTVDPVSDPPVAVDDEYSMQEDDTLRVSAPNGLLSNDFHPDGKSFQVSEVLLGTPDNGTTSISTDGSFRYTPEANFAGTDQFVYEISDGVETDTATVTINVEQINDRPTISELADQTIEEDSSAGPIDFTVGDVETPPSNLDVTTASSDTDLVPTDSVEIGGSGADRTVTVTPTADSFGTATISLTVIDQEVDGKAAKDSTQSFQLTVNSVNDAPTVTTNEGLTLEEGTTETISADSLSASDVEDPATDLTFDVTSEPENGTLLVGGSAASSFTQADLEAGAVSYSHDGSETTEDSFTFDLSDSAGAGPTGQTFAITIEPVNDAPTVTTNEGLTLEEGGSATIPADSLSASDSDDAAADLTFDVTGGPDHGAITVGGDTASAFTQADLEAGAVAYSHDDSETTADSFTFDLTDPDGAGPTGQTFDITVEPVNEGPTISGLPEADTIDEDTSTDPIGFTIGDPETPPSNLTVTDSTDNPDLIESVEFGGSGASRTVTVTPAADSNGTADITVTVVNGGQKTASQTFTLTVEPVNDPPVISGLPEADTIDEDESAGPIGFRVSDVESDSTALALSGSSDNAALVPDDSIEIGENGVTVTPRPDSNGSANITITATDPGDASTEETFTLTVDPVADPPVAVNDTFSVDENDELVRSAANGFLANDFHPDGEDFQASPFALSGPENGEVNIGSDGSFRYTPAEGFSGTDQFVYQISDGDSTDTGTVTVNVEAIEVTISGSVSYPGEGDTGLTDGRPLSGVPVQVSAVSGSESAMDITDTDGSFSVSVGTGEYAVEAQVGDTLDVPSGAINALDASRTILAFLGTRPFVDDLQEEAADVNESGRADATDALLMARFGLGLDSTFAAGDWATTTPTVDVTDGSDASVSVLAAAYGDANLSGANPNGGGGAVATASSTSPSADLKGESDLRSVDMEKPFEVPVRISDGATLGSYSLEVDFPADRVKFEGVADTDRNVMSAAEEGTVRLSWFDRSGEQPMKLGSGAPLVTLRFSAAEGVKKGTAVTPEVTAGELAGPDAQPLTSAKVSVAGVEVGSIPDEFALNGSYPNPVSGGQATVEMDLPNRATVTVEVYNTLGQRVQTIEKSMSAGKGQTLQVDGSRLASGQYFYRVKADLGDSTAEETGRITVVR